jgi:hypothetical protein
MVKVGVKVKGENIWGWSEYNPGMKQKLFSGTLDNKSFILTVVKKVIGKIKLCNQRQRSWV